MEVLRAKNGFYAFESALLCRPLRHENAPFGLTEWNDIGFWKGEYQQDLRDVLFFAEDIFGVQFCIRAEEVCIFEPETGLFTSICSSLEAWAAYVLGDINLATGYPLAHDWQLKNGPLTPGSRLLPKLPFVVGGKYELGNLYTLDDAEGMRFRASIANQIRDLPDGSQITFKTRA
jgi:hypothetical protein